jgi:hypothetical protein
MEDVEKIQVNSTVVKNPISSGYGVKPGKSDPLAPF